MAKKIDYGILCSNADVDKYREWCTFINDVFLLGLINVIDAGQADLITIALPTEGMKSNGYKIYSTNDTLTPVFIKVEFGAYYEPHIPAIWVTVATQFEVGGHMGGVILLDRTYLNTTLNDPLTPNICFGSADTNRVCFAMFCNTISQGFWFSFERRKDANINDTDHGVIIDGGLCASTHFSLCAPFEGAIPAKQSGCQFILTANNPGIYGNDVPVGLRVPCLGPSEPVGKNVAFCNSFDFGNFAEPVLTINTEDITFKHAGLNFSNLRGGFNSCFDPVTRLLLRFD